MPVWRRQFYLHDYDCSDGFGRSTDSRCVDGIVDDGRSGSLCDAAGKNFKQTVWYAVGLNVLFMIIGLFAAFYLA